MTLSQIALFGLGWHAALVLIIDGMAREDYHELVALLRTIPPCPGRSTDDVRESMKPFTRRRTSPVGAAFALWWKAHHSRGGGTRFRSNRQVDVLGRVAWILGLVVLMLAVSQTMSMAAAMDSRAWSVLLGIGGGGVIGGLVHLGAARRAIRRQRSLSFVHVLVVLLVEIGGAVAGAALVGSLMI